MQSQIDSYKLQMDTDARVVFYNSKSAVAYCLAPSRVTEQSSAMAHVMASCVTRRSD
jgi:hypothetical protein